MVLFGSSTTGVKHIKKTEIEVSWEPYKGDDKPPPGASDLPLGEMQDIEYSGTSITVYEALCGKQGGDFEFLGSLADASCKSCRKIAGKSQRGADGAAWKAKGYRYS